MFSTLRRFIAPPAIPDDDQARTVYLLNIILWVILGFGFIGNLALWILGIAKPTNIVVAFIVLLGTFGLRWLLRRGQLHAVIIVLSMIVLVGSTFIIYTWGTIRLLQAGYLLVVFGLPTLLWSRRVGLIFLILSIVVLFTLAQMESAGWLPVSAMPTLQNQWIVFSLVAIGIYVFLGLARWVMVGSLEQARRELRARQRSEKRMRLMTDILRHLNATPNVSQAFPEIAAELKTLTGCQAVAWIFFNPAPNCLQAVLLDDPLNVLSIEPTLSLDQAAAAITVRQGLPHLSPDLTLETNWPVENWLVRIGFRSMITLPMYDDAGLNGALSLLWQAQAAYDEADVPTLAQIADAMALALARSRAFDEVQRRVQEADTLRQASAILTNSFDQEKASGLILDQLQRVVPHHSASVMLLRDGYLELIGGRGWDGVNDVVGLRFAIPGDNPNTKVIETCQVVVLADAPAVYPKFGQPPFNAAGPIRSWLGIPLILQERIIGMLTLDSPQPAYFTAEHIYLCSAFADQVAVVLENARLFAEARQRAAELEASVHELEQFSYTLSHDLRAPLRAIDGYAHILLDEKAAGLDAGSQRYVQQMATNARKMGRMLDDLLAFIRLGQRKPHRQACSLSELTRQLLAELQPKLTERSLQIQVGELPTWCVDGWMIQQVFRELILNAIQFTNHCETPRIEIGCRQTEYGDACFVRDNGIGFDMNYAHQLFQMFQRLYTDSDGTGVGLALTQRIIHSHGGRIWSESAPGKGATFYFTVSE